jgi:hypothetical protein
MDQDTLVKEQIDAGKAFIDDFAQFKPVKVAFWLKASGESRWYLYVAYDKSGGSSVREDYRRVLQLLGHMQNPFLDAFDVKLVGMDDPVAKAALEIRDRSPAPLATLLRDRQIGGLIVEGAYIYPRPIAVPVP